jgi:hypothetical protein
MTSKPASTVLLLCLTGLLRAGVAHAEDPIKNWWQDTGREPGWGKPCQIKVETKQGTATKVVTCPKGVETPWAGQWKDEFSDGPCKVKLEAGREVFRAEMKCPPR